MLRKFFFPLMAIFIHTGCAEPSTMISISPKITLPQQASNLMGVTVSITGSDQRKNQILARVTRNNQLVALTASRDPRFLLQEVLEKQLSARGYMISSNTTVDLEIIIHDLYAEVFQSNMRYNILTKADIAIIANAINGKKMTKNYRANYYTEGMFQATNKNISDAVNNVLTNIISDMSQDSSIYDFIKQNSH